MINLIFLGFNLLTLSPSFCWSKTKPLSSSSQKISWAHWIYRSFIKRQASGTSSGNEWQRMTTSDNEWYNEWQRITTSENEWYNEWQRMTMSGTTNDNKWYNEWPRVTANEKEWQRMRKSNKKWQWVTTSGSKWYNEWKQHSTPQGMDDCHPFYDKNRYTTSRDGWIQLEWLNKYTALKFFQKSSMS